jgi:hypothetical protein
VTTRRETAIAAVFARLQGLATAAGPSVTRSEVLPEHCPAGGLVNLREGEPELIDETLGVVTLHFSEELQFELIVAGADGPARAAALDTLATALAAALDLDPDAGGDPTMGGAMDHARLMPLRSVEDLPVAGAAALKAAILPLGIDYVTGPNPMEDV